MGYLMYFINKLFTDKVVSSLRIQALALSFVSPESHTVPSHDNHLMDLYLMHNTVNWALIDKVFP